MKRPSPLVQMTLALVGLCGTLVLLADMFFGLMPGAEAQTRHLRKNIGEALAIQVAALMQSEDRAALQRTFDGVLARTQDVQSLAIRRGDGTVLMQAGDHDRTWQPTDDNLSHPEQVIVPLNAAGSRWGSFEIAFRTDAIHPVWRFLTQPLMLLMLFISGAGTLVFGLYMRRALQHLDPASVIPERVQGAFDAMAEGVVVLDARGRLLLANKAFRALHADAPEVATGQTLSAVPWLSANLPADLSQHPWVRAMSERAANAGQTLEIDRGGPAARILVINSAPITEPSGSVRGCIVTFDDVSELHRAHEALHEAMAELKSSKEELQRQNVELEHLATRDPLTGCLNRRAFYEAFEALLLRARSDGTALSCVMVDIDRFKSINDTHGHAVGDQVIQSLAKRMLETVRVGDLVGRYGGEEFCVVLPGLALPEASAFAERLRSRIEAQCGAAVRDVDKLRVTASLGVDALSPGSDRVAVLIDHADQALYRAKRGGRNQVCHFDADSQAQGTADKFDPVSKCLLPAAFQPRLNALLLAARARGEVLSAIQFSIDPYRLLLASAGAEAADAAVRSVAGILRENTGPNHLLVRLDTEHFAWVAANRSINDALLVAEQVRSRVQAECSVAGAVRADDVGHSAQALTVSAGVDSLPAAATGASTLVERAGKALLRAKREGGNRVNRFAAAVEAPERGTSPAAAKSELAIE